MSTYLPAPLRRQLEEADDHACAYCQTTQASSGQLMTTEHIQPESKGGKTEFANLCLLAGSVMSTKDLSLNWKTP